MTPITMLPPTTTVSTPIRLQRLFWAIGIALGPFTFLVYALFDPTSGDGRAAIDANIAANGTTNQVHLVMGVIASFLLPIGYLGMALLVLRRAPWLGTIALILALPGWTALSALIGVDALTNDMAQIGGGTAYIALWDRFYADGVTSSYILIYAFCHELCAILLGVAFWRTRLIPRWAATALILSTPLTIIGFPTNLPMLLYIALGCLFIGSVLAAVVMMQGQGERTPGNRDSGVREDAR